jgi:Zn-dependent protease with chaperone function
MFALRGLAVSLAVFVLAYSSLSLVIAHGWKLARRAWPLRSARANADFLFGLRMLPLAVSVLVTGIFVVPSFLFLEPHSTNEPIGVIPLGLSFCCVALFAAGWFKAAAALRRTSQMVAGWMKGGTSSASRAALPVVQVRGAAPALTVAGIHNQKVLIAEAAAAVLTEAELQTALRHEVAHVRRRDNLKKLLFRLCAFSGMAPLENAWREAAEMAADDAAVSNSGEALDLAAALIKLSRFAPGAESAELTTALLHSSQVTARVERLMAWNEAPRRRFRFAYALAPALGMMAAAAMGYTTALAQVHVLTEWLVR